MSRLVPTSRSFHPARRHPSPRRGAQRGVALVVALILLVVITLVGLAAVRGTIMQQKMSANMYDRQVAFQGAEAAMRAAAASIPTSPGDVARNCQSASVKCLADPFSDPDLPAGSIKTLSTAQYTAGTLATGQPQYVVENMGNFQDPSANTGFNQSANSHNYGVNGGAITNIYYRVTARSGDPAQVGGRAVVVLQAMIKQG
ncbi:MULTISPECIES: pilus assembly PilX family protein [Rhodanobacter]|uniref:pilus assembly PilX family protein n=1 Tax=Rhodanobacter TaxID=75309 RepID=UPI001F2963F9|nr:MULTISPECIES: PilX N-terminal domain-containing pilus assembly protein [Rhodanobacter]UJJ56265.1 PilX N-terminal domain-containing pilus assembly protein [Rhodanobacter thiooxydans]